MPKIKVEKTRNFRSLTITLAVAFLALSAVILLIVGSLDIYFDFKNQRKLVVTQQQIIAQNAANSVKGFVQEKISLLESAANLGDMATVSLEGQKFILEKLIGVEPAFRQLTLFNIRGDVLIKSSRGSDLLSGELIEHLDTNLFDRMSRERMYISSVYIDDVTSEPLVIMAVPVKDVFDEFKGILTAEVNLKFMWDLVDRLKIGNNGLAYVVNRQGNLIAFGNISRVLKGENLAYLREVNEFLKGGDEIIAEVSKGIQGNYVVATFVSLGIPDWAVMIELPILEAYEAVVTALKLSVLTIILSFTIAVIAGVYLAKKITKPIICLRDIVRKIGNGDLGARIEVESNDETGQLAVSFNQMLEDLKKTTVSRNSLMKEIAEREKAEETMKQLNQDLENTIIKVEEANDNLKKFVYIASHDLREPLRKITSFGELLKKSLSGKLCEEDDENLSYMVDGAERMSQMIEGLLAYSRVSTKGQTSQTIDLNELIEQLKELELSVLIDEKKVTLEIPQNLPYVEADPVQIRQLLQNLIANGIKYQKKDSKPCIIITSRLADDGMVRIEVADNGIGIKPEYQSEVFKMFRRLHSRNEYEGTGIGLSVCKKIAERHGGYIGVESEYGQGSVFWFTIPAAKTVGKKQG